MLKKRTRFVALLLALTIAAPNVVWADTGQEIDVSGLRVSEAFAAKHPNGMFEVLSPYITTGEGKEFDFYVLRRGGTEGAASVNIKAVEISAKYGEDFILQERDALGFYHDLEKSEDTPTLYEAQIEQNKDILFTTDRLASGAALDVYGIDDIASGAALEVADGETVVPESTETAEVSDDTNTETAVPESIGTNVTIDDALKQEEEAPVVAYSDDMGGYTSALHKMRDEATGKTTPTVSDSATYSLDDLFETKDKEQVQLMNDAAEAFDGLSYTVDFKDGEAYKIIHVKITDDDVYEAQEAFELALFDPTNGAEIGEQNASDVIIDDDEKVEKCDISFALENYQAFSDSDGVTVVLKREGNVNDYVSVYVSTLADTAKADEDYTPVMGDIMFLPGETEKKIFVPILKDNLAAKDLTESLYFDITAETEDNANITGKSTRVEILPFANNDNKSLINVSGDAEVKAYSDEDAPIEAFAASSEYFKVLDDCNASKSVAWNKECTWKPAWYQYNDLTGVEYVEWEWKNDIESSSYNSRQISYFGLDDYEVSKYKGWSNWEKKSISSETMAEKGLRKAGVKTWMGLFVSTDNKMDLSIRNARAYYTEFKFLTQAPDKMTAYVYNGTTENDRIKEADITFTPGTTWTSTSTFTRGSNIGTSGFLNEEGRQYGCSVKDVALTGNGNSKTISCGYFNVYSDFIKNYIYNGDQSKSTLTAKANFERTEKVSKIHIDKYENGVVKLGDKVINDTDLTSSAWYKGDKLRLSISPNQGYHVAKITAGGRTYKQGEDISLENNMTIKVEFARDDNYVIVTHDYVGTYANEDLDVNKKRGIVFSPLLADEYEQKTTSIEPITREQFLAKYNYNRASMTNEKNEILLSHYKKYVEDNGLVDKFTNEIPEGYLRCKGYLSSNDRIGSNVNFDYKSKLTTPDYEILIPYFQYGSVSQAVYERGLYSVQNALYLECVYYLRNSRKYRDYLIDNLDIHLEYGYYEAYWMVSYNGKKITADSENNLFRKLCLEMYYDNFAHTEDFVNMALNLPTVTISGDTKYYFDFSKKSDMEILALAMVPDGFLRNSIPNFDEHSILLEYIEPQYQEYLKEIEAQNAAAAREAAIYATGKFAINNLTTGDTVNLMAELEDGYTCVWLYNDDANYIDETDQPIYTIHVGDSFSFDVQNKAATVKYYFVPINSRLPDTFIHGRVIRPNQTLRTPSSERLNINDSSTYQAVQGMDITIGSIDPYAKGEINGKTYYPTTQTDANGYFDVLVPHGMEGLMTNLIFANGEKTFVKHAVILNKDSKKNQTIIFAIPYQDDNIWVRSFNFENCDESKQDGIAVSDKNITLTAQLDIADGYAVNKVVLRSYNCKGGLVKAWEMNPQGGGKYQSTFNAKEYLKDGGRLTIEPYDGYGRGVGQVESGCIFTEPPVPTDVEMPAMPDLGGANLDTVGEFAPELDTGNYTMQKEKSDYTTTDKGTPFEIAILGGSKVKTEIKQMADYSTPEKNPFISGTAAERVNTLTAVIDPLAQNVNIAGATGASGSNTASKPSDMGTIGAKGGKLSHSVGLDIGFYIRLNKITDEKGTKYYFEQMYIIIGANLNIQKDFQIFIGPVPCYITIKGGITIKGIIGMIPNKDVNSLIEFDGIKMKQADFFKEGGMDVAGTFLVKPRFSLGAGVGVRGAVSVGVSGNVTVTIVYQPWTDGAGTIQFSLNVDIDLGPIPLTFEIAQVTYGLFYTENYQKNYWLDFSQAENAIDFDNYLKTLSVDDETTVNGSMNKIARGHGNTLETPVRAFSADEESESPIRAFAENELRGTLKHPKPQLLHLSGKKQIMFYLGDDLSRDVYDGQAVYYVLYDGNDWGQPAKVDDDGTADLDFNAVQAGDKVILVHSDLNKQFGGSLSDVPEYLNSADMSVIVFDENGNKGEEKKLTTEDNFSNSMPRIAYDEKTGRTLIAYLATDYSDSRADFGYSTMGELSSFLNNSYGTVCYKMLDKDLNEVGYSQNEVTYLAYEEHYGEGSLDNQRFVPLAADTLNVNEMTANAFEDKVYITYTVDTDGNSETSEDMELYASVIDINNNSSVGPIRLTTNDVQDSNPQTVEYDGKVYIYWNRNGNIVYSDLDGALNGGVTQTSEGYTAGDMFYYEVQEGSDAAQTFRISYEPNGILYLTWNQIDSYIEVEGEEENSITKRNIYMRTYDPHYDSETYTDEETGETKYIYSGNWGAATKFDVPDNNYEMFSEQTFTALDKDTAMCAYRHFKWENDGTGVKESANSDLIISRYHVASSLNVTDVYSDPEYPATGDDATLHIKVENAGVLPTEKVTFKAKMTDSEGNVTDLGEDVVNTHLATSGEVEGSFTYKVPENGDSYKFSITAWEENYTENKAEFEKEFVKGAVIENIDPELTRTNNAYAKIKAAFVNRGNKATGEMTFKVKSRNNVENSQYVELLSIPVNSLEPDETASIEEEFAIGEGWGEGNMQRLFISLENADGSLYNEITDLYLLSDEDLEVTDIVINDGDESTIEVNAGEWAYPHFEITPVEASASNSLVYSISDSDIADIDSSNGRVYGKKEGTATITVSAVNSRYSLFVDEDNSTYDSAGNLILFDENGVVNEPTLAEAGSDTAVMTKTVQVKVTGTLPETTTEITTESTTETASEVTTKSSTSRSSGGGGGGSSRAASATATTEETSEETTTDVENGTEATTENVIAENYNGFIDVKGMWCENIVNTLHDQGLVNGRTEELFAPDDNLTRAELVQLLANLSGADLSAYANADGKFTDVDKNAWYYAAVMWAADNNIVYGIGNDMFAPDTSITREDTAAIIFRYMGIDAAEENNGFSDTDEISGYAKDAVNTLSAQGIINGYPDNTFRPKNTITRAEAAAVLYGVNEK
ncbi:MAG: S-layer homology domain-containing protein [Firmicutes bacterium]|nr:S-layer homology domain-containing protein [Bacillota bacterium]